MRRNDGKFRHFFVKLAEPAVAVPQEQRLSGALFETALVIDRIAHVKQAPRG